jgi:hypothetical protein
MHDRLNIQDVIWIHLYTNSDYGGLWLHLFLYLHANIWGRISCLSIQSQSQFGRFPLSCLQWRRWHGLELLVLSSNSLRSRSHRWAGQIFRKILTERKATTCKHPFDDCSPLVPIVWLSFPFGCFRLAAIVKLNCLEERKTCYEEYYVL